MARHEVVVTVQATNPPTITTKKRRLHPVRRLARLLFKACSCSQPKSHLDVTEHTCRGPSFLHNLLPILEPFLTLDPKLLFIEDHILRRTQASYNGEARPGPSSLSELRTRVQKSSALCDCDCDECAPKLYRLSEHSSHGTIQTGHCALNRKSPRFSHVHSTPTSPPSPQFTLRFYGSYEAMRLTRHHTAWLDETYLQHPSTLDTPSVQQLQTLLRVWRTHLSGADLRQSMSVTQMQHLITQLNRVFFHNAVPPHRSAWSKGFAYLDEREKACFGVGTFNPLVGTQLLLHPVLYRNSRSNSDTTTSTLVDVDVDKDIQTDIRLRSRLGTLLHELCHAFLKAYSCRACPMHTVCIGPRGHGRAWQVLAARIEKVAERVVGGRVDLGRGPGVLNDLGSGKGWGVSLCDLEAWGVG